MYGRERTRGKFNHSLEENKEIDSKSLICGSVDCVLLIQGSIL